MHNFKNWDLIVFFFDRMLHEQECLINQMNEAYKEFDIEVVKLRADKIELDVEVRSCRVSEQVYNILPRFLTDIAMQDIITVKFLKSLNNWNSYQALG